MRAAYPGRVVQPVARRTFLSGAVVLAAAAGIDALPMSEVSAAPVRFSLQRYGAKSDGVTDDSAAIERASAAASAVRGVVVLPKGTTVWNNLSKWHPNVTYLGAPGAVAKITLGPNDGPKVVAANVGFQRISFIRGDDSSPFIRLQAPGCWIRDCHFLDTASPKSTGVNVDAEARNAVLQNNRFDHIRSTSIFLDGCTGVRLEGNRIAGQRYEVGFYSAIQMTNATKNTIVRRNVVSISPTSKTPMNGIGLAGTGNLVEHNTFRVSRFAIEAGPGVRGTIRKNFCSISSTPVTDGLNYAAGISLPKTTGMHVIGNTVDQQAATRSTWVGIELPESKGCVVKGNILYGSSHGSQGIILDSANACTVSGNTVVNYPSGITMYGHAASASNNTVTDNTVRFSGTTGTASGISVLLDATGSADRNLVQGNRISGVGVGRGVSLDRQIGRGALDGNRIGRNRVTDVGVALYRNGDTRTSIAG